MRHEPGQTTGQGRRQGRTETMLNTTHVGETLVTDEGEIWVCYSCDLRMSPEDAAAHESFPVRCRFCVEPATGTVETTTGYAFSVCGPNHDTPLISADTFIPFTGLDNPTTDEPCHRLSGAAYDEPDRYAHTCPDCFGDTRYPTRPDTRVLPMATATDMLAVIAEGLDRFLSDFVSASHKLADRDELETMLHTHAADMLERLADEFGKEGGR
jgi:hypothetical protein